MTDTVLGTTPTSLLLTQTGALRLSRNGVTLAETGGPVVAAQTSVHLEMAFNSVGGTFDLRANGVQVLNITGLPALGQITQLAFVCTSGAPGGSGMMTDLVVRDTTGPYNNAILGDRGVATLMVASDDPANQGWTPKPLQLFGTGVLQNTLSTNNTGHVRAAQSTDFDFGSGDFTVEGWFRFGTLPTGSTLAQLFGKWADNASTRSWRLYVGGPSLNGGNTRFEITTDGSAGTLATIIDWPWVPVVGTWYHVAVARASGYTMFFVDGVMQGLPVADANTYFAASTTCAVMAQANGTGTVNNTAFVGWQDEFRITKGVARYTSNFTPAGPFPRGGGDPNWSAVKWLSGWDSGVFDESASARTLTAGGSSPAPTAITPDDASAAYKVVMKNGAPLDYTFLEAALRSATGLFTMTVNPTNGETVRVGTKDGVAAATYTFKTALATAYDVRIGANIQATANNLVAAITAGAGIGTVYGTGTLANYDAVAQVLPSAQVYATAYIAGTVGNSIATTTTCANGSWASATLTGGTNIPAASQFGFQRPPIKTTVVDSVTLVSRAWKTASGPASIRQSLVGPAGGVGAGTDKPLGTSPSLYFDTFETDPDTGAPPSPLTLVGGKVRLARTV